ncbi:thioredoxin [soil metagenome]|jgi:thioredoxin 1
MANVENVEPLEREDLQSNVLQVPGPVALDFYGESCPPCHALEPRLERVAGEYTNRIPVYRLDAERDLSLAEKLGVTGLPTVLVFKDGEEVERLDGLIREKGLRSAFERAIG